MLVVVPEDLGYVNIWFLRPIGSRLEIAARDTRWHDGMLMVLMPTSPRQSIPAKMVHAHMRNQAADPHHDAVK